MQNHKFQSLAKWNRPAVQNCSLQGTVVGEFKGCQLKMNATLDFGREGMLKVESS